VCRATCRQSPDQGLKPQSLAEPALQECRQRLDIVLAPGEARHGRRIDVDAREKRVDGANRGAAKLNVMKLAVIISG